jgi:propanediol dehydratase small subunit
MTKYPLKEHHANDLHAFSGRPLSEITAEAIANGDISSDDLRIHADALRQQAQIAQQAGYEALAKNLLRAAELTLVPNDEVLKIYEMLRPDRSSWDELMNLATYLDDKYQAPENANFIREAAGVYKERGLLRR